MAKLFIVGTPIGNLEDLSFRAQRILSEVDLIAAEDTRHTKILLDHYNIITPLTSYHKFNIRAKTREIIKKIKQSKSVALVSDAGMPGISDPGYELIKEAIEEEIEVVPVPGPSAVTTALAVSGLPTDKFCFGGYIPAKKGERGRFLDKIGKQVHTVVLFEVPHRLLESLEDMKSVLGDRRIAIGRELTKKFEEVVHGSVAEVIRYFEKKEPKGEFVIVIEGKEKEEKDIKEAIELAKEMVEAGVSKKDASKIVSKFFDISKNKIYDELF